MIIFKEFKLVEKTINAIKESCLKYEVNFESIEKIPFEENEKKYKTFNF